MQLCRQIRHLHAAGPALERRNPPPVILRKAFFEKTPSDQGKPYDGCGDWFCCKKIPEASGKWVSWNLATAFLTHDGCAVTGSNER